MVALRLAADPAGPDRGRSRGRRARDRPPAPLRALLVLLAVVLLGARRSPCCCAPLEAARLWPWPLTELTGRAVGAWLVGLGWAAAHSRLIDDLPSIRPLGLTGAAFVALQAVALVRYGDALDLVEPDRDRVRRGAGRDRRGRRLDPGRHRPPLRLTRHRCRDAVPRCHTVTEALAEIADPGAAAGRCPSGSPPYAAWCGSRRPAARGASSTARPCGSRAGRSPPADGEPDVTIRGAPEVLAGIVAGERNAALEYLRGTPGHPRRRRAGAGRRRHVPATGHRRRGRPARPRPGRGARRRSAR